MKKQALVSSSELTPPTPYEYYLPDHLQKAKPTEVRGISRDKVRLMVSTISDNSISHTVFNNLGHYLKPGDVLVVNTSGTLNTELMASRQDKTTLNVHLSTKLPNNRWAVELRKKVGNSFQCFQDAYQGECLELTMGGTIELLKPYHSKHNNQKDLQLWEVNIQVKEGLEAYLNKHVTPVYPNYAREQYPQSYYQTVFANEMGSTQIPSGGRAFTPSLISQLINKGIQIVPILLHIGGIDNIGKQGPYQEYYRMPESTAHTLNAARKHGRRIIAIGTTVVRALETVTDKDGFTKSGEGWTNEFITPERGIYAVDGLLTGLHGPKVSHLLMLEALAGLPHIKIAYQAAIEQAYQWHKFGDSHLILP